MSWPALVGHEVVWGRLTALLAAERLPHALLFSGPPGIGKARLARRLAGRLACTASGADRPCGECGGCRQVLAGTHPDLLAFAAPDRTRKESRKKEIGIEHARALKRFVHLHAVAAGRKMAIIDDADRLSIAAQNALLKTLEEPPGQALIVLVTASPGALLPTVRSRCQRVLCRPLGDAQVAEVLAAGGVDADEAAALVAVADGSPGRALALRETWRDADRQEIERLLADLTPRRYGSVLAMSKGLGSSEAEIAARLDGLLGLCSAAALQAAAAADREALDVALRRADAVAEAARTLRWRNPNRALLTEALALRLARG
jgi:DNA polymerase-3 subunit delta'